MTKQDVIDKLIVIDWEEIRTEMRLLLGEMAQKEIEKTVLARLEHIFGYLSKRKAK